MNWISQLIVTVCLFTVTHSAENYGTRIGDLRNHAHGVGGTVYAVDENTFYIKGFSYDGTGPDAFFWIGKTSQPNPRGEIIPYPPNYRGSEVPVLKRFRNEDVFVKLPNGKKIEDYTYLSVWCRRFTVNFGDVLIPNGLEYPKIKILPELQRLAHKVKSGNITILDEKTLYIPNLYYDGAGPDAFFLVGTGNSPHENGIKVPNELGSTDVLKGYQGVDLELQLPGDLTVYDIDWFSVYCITFRHNFGHVMIPKNIKVPPALGQTKVATQAPNQENCKEVLPGKLQVHWSQNKDDVFITLMGKIAENQYMAFGLSPRQGRSVMIDSDVTVAYYASNEDSFFADDYYISAKSQCDGRQGVCPDERIGGFNNVEMIEGSRNDGVTTVKYRKPRFSSEGRLDMDIPTSQKVTVIAAIGNLNNRNEANYHFADRTGESDDIRIDFSSVGISDCPSNLVNTKKEKLKPWPPLVIAGETEFTARIGPTGGDRGYTAITGLPSWGIAWWINEKLIPEIYVERGKTYTFTVEGGNDRTNPAHFHPFYITNSKVGGFGQKDESEQRKEVIYAGVDYDRDGYPVPTAVGRYCEYEHKTVDQSSRSHTFEDFRRTVKLACQNGRKGTLTWKVQSDAPDVLYYQCYTHQNLGWKIKVVDQGFRLPRQDSSATTISTAFGAVWTFLMLLL